MTDITANKYRTAAKVDRFHGGQSAAQFYEDNARALESEDLVTQVAMQFAGSTWGGRDAEEQFALAGSERALAYLVGAGRLVPAGGMALTAEQAEDVRTVLNKFGFNQVTPEVVQAIEAAERLNCGGFPSTEPAAVRDGSDLVVVQRSHTAKAVQSWMTLDLWTDLGKNDKDFDAEYERQGFGDLWATLLGEVRALVQATTPAPAEPAAVEVDPRAESQAACLYAKLLAAGEDPGLIFQAVLWAYERVKSNPEIIWLEDLYQAWESRASAEATVNSTLKVPAPAEPAEEETKAEDESGWHWVQSAGGYYSGPACTGGYGCRSMAHYEGCLRPSLTASSPVVPAPTETEWPTWDAVPENVTVISSFLDHRYRKVDGEVFRVLEDGKRHKVADFTPTDMRSFAPFAAAKEG